MTSCPACSTALPPGARFCTHCSYSQTRCPFCNAHLPDPSGACLNCRRVSPSASRSVSSMPAAAPITSGYAQPNQQSYSMNVGMNLGVPQSMHQNFNFNQGMAMTQHAYRQPMIQQQAFPFGLPGSQDSNLLKTAGAGINSMQPKAFKQMSNQTFAGQSGAPKKLDSSHINPWIFANNGNGLALSSPKAQTVSSPSNRHNSNDKDDSNALDGLCVICLDKQAKMACVPCGHKCLCEDHSAGLRACPICRTNVQTVLKIYG
mmetsp:Transcript_21435/g.71002  ORF Transcript_21435/g.71002 Transcript_21435/m.71002 type:complete len:260 (-) Transcript_21435:271-1050(-)